jgi:iron complex transport system substrate-binding protein
MDNPSLKGVESMKKTTIYILTIIIIIALAATVYVYIAHQGETETFQGGDLVDDLGYSLTLTEPPERIVSLAPSNTEILFAVGAGDKVVGVTDFCNYPYDFAAWIEAGNMTSIGNYYGPSTEPIVALNPDLVLATTGSLEAAENLRELGYNVLVIEPTNLTYVLRDILLVGRATNNYNNAVTLESDISQRIDDVTSKAAVATTKPKVYHEVWNDPIMSAGPGTFIDELITLAGGQNIFDDAVSSWPTVSSEAIIDKNPDVMIFPDMYMGRANFYETVEAVKNRDGWDLISAVQNDKIYEINADIISRSGPRLADALEQMAKMIHPEIFGQP